MPPRRTNIGVDHTSFVDRESEVATLRGLIEAKRRLITLLGPAGCGKTRLARRFGALSSLDVVWFCDLCAARDTPTAAAILEHELTGISGPALIILDNFEQLAACGSSLIEASLEELPEAHFLVTSRHALGFEGETQLDLPPLDTDAAVQLFIERAALVAPRWSPTNDRQMIAALVQRLDGLPLAIELAASRMSVLSVSEILRRLPQRFAILQTHRKNVPERQSTMRAAIAWSWDLLEPWEQQALFQCNVFAAPFTLEDAEAVLDLSAIEGAPRVLDVLQALKEKSVLRCFDDHRFFWYENIGEYVRSKLECDGDFERAQVRHARHYLAIAEAAERTEALAQIADQLWAIARNVQSLEPELAARAALVLDTLLTLRGMVESRLELAELAVQASLQVGRELEGEARARRSSVLRLHGRSDEAMEEILSALPLARASGSLELEGRCLLELGTALKDAGNVDESRRSLARAIEIFRRTHDRQGEAEASCELGDLATALALHREIGDLRGEGITSIALADHDVAEDRIEDALEHYQRAIELLDSVRDQWWTAIAIGHLAHVRFETKRLEEAAALYRQAIEMMLEAGDERMAARFGAFSSVLETGAIDALENFGSGAADRILRAHRAEAKADEEIDRVEVPIDGRWFRTASGGVNLARRKVLRRLLGRLAEQRRDRPGDPVAPDLLVEAGWPDENLAHKAAVARLYVSISTLRKLGLREVLLMKDEGYLLDPERTKITLERPSLTMSIKDALKGFVSATAR